MRGEAFRTSGKERKEETENSTKDAERKKKKTLFKEKHIFFLKFITSEISFEEKIYKPGCVRETFIHTQMNILCGKKTRVSSQKCKAYNKRKRKKNSTLKKKN